MTEIRKSRKDRLSVVTDPTDAPFIRDSLIGSYFLGDVTAQYQGCVIAEPCPGIYLVELFDWLIGESSEQRLVKIERMMNWHFFDEHEWMRNAYRDRVGPGWRHAEKADDQ